MKSRRKVMQKIVYIGSIDKVEVPMPDGSRVHVAREQELSTTAAHAASLVESGNWRPTTAASSNKKEA